MIWTGKTKHEPNCLSISPNVTVAPGTVAPCTCGLELSDRQRRIEILTLAKQFDSPAEAVFTLSAAIAATLVLSASIKGEDDVTAAMDPIMQQLRDLALDAFRTCKKELQ